MVLINMIESKKNKYSNIVFLLLSILIFLVLFSPTVFQYVKLVPLTLLFALSILNILKKNEFTAPS